MALPETDIYTALVKNEIGESINDIGGLVLSANVNRWGINSPNAPQQSKYWGVSAPDAPHEFGMFRRYDHYWRCFSVGDVDIDATLATYRNGYIYINLKFFPAWSTIVGTTTHYFDVFMNRNSSSFANPAYYTQIGDNVAVNNDGSYSLLINPTAPPDDTETPLSENSTFWLKFKHVSSDARRFDVSEFDTSANIIADPNDSDAWIVEVSVGEYPFTNQIMVSQSVDGLIVSKYSGGNYIAFGLTFSNTYESQQTIANTSIKVQINNQADFNGATDTVITSTAGVVIPEATYDGTLHAGTQDMTAQNSVTLNNWSLGQAFYGRVSFDGGLTWHTGFNGTVSNTPL